MANVIIKNCDNTSYLDTLYLSLTADQCRLLEFLQDNNFLAYSVEFEVLDEFQKI